MDIINFTAIEIVNNIADGKLASVEVAESLKDRAESCHQLNALINFDPNRFMDAARMADETLAEGGDVGPLHGLPIVVKDNIDVTGYATTAATPALKNHYPNRTAPVVQKLLDAGAIIMSKTNMHEMAFSPGVSPPEDGSEIIWGAFGNTRNPYDTDRSPAGSSSGTGASIGARIAPVGLGSDTGGSVRNPAAWCGIAGLRPTSQRYSQKGVVPISWTRDTIGPMSRTVADLELLDRVIMDEVPVRSESLAGVRLGLDRSFFCTDCDPDILTLFETEIDRLASAGAEVLEITIPGLAGLIGKVGPIFAAYEFIRAVPIYLSETGANVSLSELISQVAASGLGSRFNSINSTEVVSDDAYNEALTEVRPAIQAAYLDAFEACNLNALIFPSTILSPTLVDYGETHLMGGVEVPDLVASSRNVQPASIGGFAGLTVPMGLTPNGLPSAIGFDGPPHSDRKLLSIGMAYETLRADIPAPSI